MSPAHDAGGGASSARRGGGIRSVRSAARRIGSEKSGATARSASAALAVSGSSVICPRSSAPRARACSISIDACRAAAVRASATSRRAPASSFEMARSASAPMAIDGVSAAAAKRAQSLREPEGEVSTRVLFHGERHGNVPAFRASAGIVAGHLADEHGEPRHDGEALGDGGEARGDGQGGAQRGGSAHRGAGVGRGLVPCHGDPCEGFHRLHDRSPHRREARQERRQPSLARHARLQVDDQEGRSKGDHLRDEGAGVEDAWVQGGHDRAAGRPRRGATESVALCGDGRATPRAPRRRARSSGHASPQ
jgi:hypothetical protein